MKRRTFLLMGAGVAGALVVGWGVKPAPQTLLSEEAALPSANGETVLNGWVRIDTTGIVTIAVPRAEMGQGIYTGIPQMLADELGCAWHQVRVEQAPIDSIYGNVAMLVDSLPFHPDDHGAGRKVGEWFLHKVARNSMLIVTGGSSSVKDAWIPVRQAGASARELLVRVAATRFGVDAALCRVSDGIVTAPNGLKAGFGELADAAGKLKPNANPPLKAPKDRTLIGTSVGRVDSRIKSTGQAQFGIDVRIENMLYAAIKQHPLVGSWRTGGAVEKFEADEARTMKGVHAVLSVAGGMGGAHCGVAVVAQSYWQAKQALNAVNITWTEGSTATLDSAAIAAQFKRDLELGKPTTFHKVGTVNPNFDALGKKIEATYSAPFAAHVTMEPMNCTALVTADSVEVWAPTQAPAVVRWIAAKVAGVKSSQVTVHATYLGGGFGRRGEIDFVVQAVQIAKQVRGHAVQLIWSREEDMTHDMYRPAALAKFQAGFDSAGKVEALLYRGVSGSVMGSMVRRLGFTPAGPDKTNAEGAADKVYEFPNVRYEHVLSETPVPQGFWRSVGHSQNAFFMEAFVDEMAAAVGQDPLAFRLNHLKNHKTHSDVLNLAAEKAGWGKPLAAGRARGMALHESFGSIVAQVVEVSIVEKDGKKLPRVHRVVCALCCGPVINPDIVKAQMESGVIFALSAAVHGEITLKRGAVEQANFPQYDMVRMSDAPVVETHILPANNPDERPGGVGEPGVPPLAPALANALFKLTGKPVRSLPIRL